MDLPPDVEAEIDYQSGRQASPEWDDVLYRECVVSAEGHFPLLKEELCSASLPESERRAARAAFQKEFSQLRTIGNLGNVMILRESVYIFINRKLGAGIFRYPMQICFALKSEESAQPGGQISGSTRWDSNMADPIRSKRSALAIAAVAPLCAAVAALRFKSAGHGAVTVHE
jgi:hypothetical protein